MIRLSALFVAVCMLLIAASFGGVLFLLFGVPGPHAAVVSIAALTGLAVYHAVSTRIRYQSELSSQLGDLSRGTADLARPVAEQGRRLATLERNSEAAVQKAVAVSQPLQSELAELGTLMRELAQNVATQEAALRALAAQQTSASAPLVPDAGPPPALASLIPSPLDPTPAPPRDTPPGPFRGMEPAAIVEQIRLALTENRVEIYLQPIVTLPQRKVRHYEALARMRMPDDTIVAAEHFLPHAEAAGLMPAIDYLMVGRCVRVLRRLQAKNSDTGVFCNLSPETLSDREGFAQIIDFAEANRVLAKQLMFEVPYRAVRHAGTQENEALAKLTDLGFRLSIDHVPDLRFDARELAERKCGFIKIRAAVLLDRNFQAAADIHPADIAGLLQRNGVELIAERIETEENVVDLLDFDLKYGQGNLFSPPRPVKPDTNGKGHGEEPMVEQTTARAVTASLASINATANGLPPVDAPVGAAPPPSKPAVDSPVVPSPVAGSTLARLARIVARQ